MNRVVFKDTFLCFCSLKRLCQRDANSQAEAVSFLAAFHLQIKLGVGFRARNVCVGARVRLTGPKQ